MHTSGIYIRCHLVRILCAYTQLSLAATFRSTCVWSSQQDILLRFLPCLGAQDDAGIFTLTDAGSHNGTFLNGARVPSLTGATIGPPLPPRALRHRDLVQLGSQTLLQVHLHPGDYTCSGCNGSIAPAPSTAVRRRFGGCDFQ
jgi:hypothetical protein